MLIEQIIEFELLRGRGPPSRMSTYTRKTGYFHDTTKISKANTGVIVYC